MPIITGTATDIEDLIDVQLKAFLIQQGWTVNENVWPFFTSISRGSCFVNFRVEGSDEDTAEGVQDFTDAFGFPHELVGMRTSLSSAYTDFGSASTRDKYEDQPNSLDDRLSSNDGVRLNDLRGPFNSFTFFANENDINALSYCHCVIETLPGFYVHFCFGEVNKLDATYTSNAAYLFGTRYRFLPNTTTIGSRSDINFADSRHDLPFNHNSGNAHIYVNQADPSTTEPIKQGDNILSLTAIDDSSRMYTGLRNSAGAINDPILRSGSNPLNGTTVLAPIIIGARTDNDVREKYILGQVPNMRMCNMANVAPGDLITLGSDSWRVFPWRKIQPDDGFIPEANHDTSPPYDNTSAFFGFAYRNV